jgi:hypothetical protein
MRNWTAAFGLAGEFEPPHGGGAGGPAGPVKKAEIRQVVAGLNNPRNMRGLP